MNARTASCLALAATCALTSLARAQAVAQPDNNPIATPVPTGLTLRLADFQTVPSSNGAVAPLARIQYLTPAPDASGRLFVNDTRGILYQTSTARGATPQVYLDLRNRNLGLLTGTGEQGLLGFAFHPNFNGDANAPGYGKFYTSHTAGNSTSPAPDFGTNAASGLHGVLNEWSVNPTLSPGQAGFSIGTPREVLRVAQPFGNHNIASLAFSPLAAPGSPDYGNLYIGYGDGGSGDDPFNSAENINSPLGKILRIQPIVATGSAKYALPSGVGDANPFVGQPTASPPTGGPSAASLVYAYGFRHPQQFNWDRGATAAMTDDKFIINDIGQANVEEVSIGAKGGNYGWRDREGTFATANGAGQGNFNAVYTGVPKGAGVIDPRAQYDHSEGAAISSGFVYRGTRVPELRGKYLFADIVNGRVFYTDLDGPQSADGTTEVFAAALAFERADGSFAPSTFLNEAGYSNRVDLRFGIDAAGELYLLSKGDGQVRAIVPEPSALALLGVGGLGLLRRRRGRR